MTSKHPHCVAIEPDLVASATGEAPAPVAALVDDHVARCVACREDFQRYRAIDALTGEIRVAPVPVADEAAARARLTSRLADLRRRMLRYRIFRSPLGPILLARSEEGVALVEYLQSANVKASRLTRLGDEVELVEDRDQLERLTRELTEFIEGRRAKLDWPLDLRLVRGDFDRTVLRATSGIPYGAVSSYAAVARQLGKPSAVRAVAQALRWNPLPLVIPCHRVIGSGGTLTGYAGNKLTLKQRLLSVEGIPTVRSTGEFQIARQATYARDYNDAEYCLPTCGSISKRSLAEVQLFGSRESAEAAGFRPCTSCRPDLHPLG